MTFDEFNNYTEELLGQVTKMRDTKGKEYANSLDRFDNFNRLSKRLDLDRLKVAWVYFIKHIDAIESYIKTGKVISEPINGRIVDATTYLTLIGGMIRETEGLDAKAGKFMPLGESPIETAIRQKQQRETFQKELDEKEKFYAKLQLNMQKARNEEIMSRDAAQANPQYTPITCSCKGIAIPPHITACPLCGLFVNHPVVEQEPPRAIDPVKE